MSKLELKNEKQLEKIVGGYTANFTLGASSLTLGENETPLGIKDALINAYPQYLSTTWAKNQLTTLLTDWQNNHGSSKTCNFNLSLSGVSNISYS